MITKEIGEIVAAAVRGEEIEWSWKHSSPPKYFQWFGKLSDLEDPKKIFRIANEAENRVRFRLGLIYNENKFKIQTVNSAAEAVELMKHPEFVEWFSDWCCEDVSDQAQKTNNS